MPATISEIARLVNASHSTVSRLVSGDQRLRISKERRHQILKVIKQRGGCVPHHTARALVSRSTGVMQWPINRDQRWVLSHDSYVGRATMGAAEDALRKGGSRLAVVFYSEADKHVELPLLFSQPGFSDGVIFTWGVVDQILAGVLMENRYPHVVLDPSAAPFGVHMVIADQAVGIQEAADHLVSLGHRRIGWIGRAPAMDRFDIFRQCLARRGLDVHETDVALEPLNTNVPGWDIHCRDLGHSAMTRLLDEGGCTAVCCDTDGFAFGVIDALRDKGLEPGRDMSVVGYDDLEHWGWQPFGKQTLSTVHNPLDQIGRCAAESLMRQVNQGWFTPEIVRVPTKFIVRATTGPVATNRRQ